MYYPWWPAAGEGCTFRPSVKVVGALLPSALVIYVSWLWWSRRGQRMAEDATAATAAAAAGAGAETEAVGSQRARMSARRDEIEIDEIERMQRQMAAEGADDAAANRARSLPRGQTIPNLGSPPRVQPAGAAGGLAAARMYPTGAWRGYYTHPAFDGGQHGVVEFQLRFTAEVDHRMLVRGEGVDDVGAYTIAGVATRGDAAGGSSGAIRFTKEYEAGSRNAAGVVRSENKGHRVEYIGRPARTDALGQPVLANGIRGEWSIAAFRRFTGVFHLWPVMPTEYWAGMAEGAAEAGQAAEDDSECVVCYDRRIDVGLEPCGHVALCAQCAARLRPRRCPLCRTQIHAVVAVHGT